MSLELALHSLLGLSIGDGYGERQGWLILSSSYDEVLPAGPWHWTDDTHMAITIVEHLAEHGEIHPDLLVKRFAERYMQEPNRGYAGQAQMLLRSVHEGMPWTEATTAVFPTGSYGNGGAMRAAPIGAFYEDNPARAAMEAQKASMVTHAHPEGQAGGMAVAAAAAIMARCDRISPADFIEEVAEYIPDSATKINTLRGVEFKRDEEIEAAEALGTGFDISAQRTAPFCIWVAANFASDFEAALAMTASLGGDCDTTCAIVGGIIASGTRELPAEWIKRTEPLPKIV